MPRPTAVALIRLSLNVAGLLLQQSAKTLAGLVTVNHANKIATRLAGAVTMCGHQWPTTRYTKTPIKRIQRWWWTISKIITLHVYIVLLQVLKIHIKKFYRATTTRKLGNCPSWLLASESFWGIGCPFAPKWAIFLAVDTRGNRGLLFASAFQPGMVCLGQKWLEVGDLA